MVRNQLIAKEFRRHLAEFLRDHGEVWSGVRLGRPLPDR
ncbi:MAG: hypothetical protein QOG69_1318, partial [Actinomycetota bacterium]|nr:hypothetical protein [Actinomycetota bacterium]